MKFWYNFSYTFFNTLEKGMFSHFSENRLPFCRKGSKNSNLVWISLKWIKTKRKTKKKFFSKVPFFCTGTSKTLYWRPGISTNMCHIKNLIHAFCRSALVLYKRKKNYQNWIFIPRNKGFEKSLTKKIFFTKNTQFSKFIISKSWSRRTLIFFLKDRSYTKIISYSQIFSKIFFCEPIEFF